MEPTTVSPWLHVLAIASLTIAAASAIAVAVHEIRHRQHMWIMNVVWPITALWSGPLGLIGYFSVGRLSTHEAMLDAERHGRQPPNQAKPFWQTVAVAATHCGSGCSLGDLVVEWLVLAVPITIFGHHVFGTWLADYVAAFLFGIVFQYFTITPMKHLSPGDGVVAAVKADALSLTSWQLGMYGWMAIVLFVLFSPERLPKTAPEFWFMMQIAMVAGFLTSYPVNWWLLRARVKEPM